MMIDKAAVIDDLRIPHANRLERLRGDLTGFNAKGSRPHKAKVPCRIGKVLVLGKAKT